MRSSSDQQQSGIGAEPHSVASLLWKHIVLLCESMFQYTPISVAMHSTDLLPHAACVYHITSVDNDTRHRMTDVTMPELLHSVPPHANSVGLFALPRSYYQMGFVIQSFSMRSGYLLPLSTCDADPSYPYGGPIPDDVTVTEDRALVEVEQTITSSRTSRTRAGIYLFVIEPLLVPGGGHTYRGEFLIRLQDLLRRLSVLIIADETLSFVRCGSSLFSKSIPRFAPDMVMIGKGLGCSILMVKKSPAIMTIFQRAFSITSAALSLLQACCTLRVMAKGKIAERCHQEGKRLLQRLHQIPGVSARGVGYCLWVDDGLHALPIASCINGRLLPRVDQDADTLDRVLTGERAITARLLAQGRLEEVRVSSCAICGDECRTSEGCFDCRACSRQYHRDCAATPRGKSTPLDVCRCGGVFQHTASQSGAVKRFG
jgi:hypothetical protein